MAAQIAIYTYVREYDALNDVWNVLTTTWYLGKARVQPLRGAMDAEQTGDNAPVQTFLFSIPVAYQSLDLTTAMDVHVLDAGLNTTLEAFDFRITEIADSSNPIEKTFLAQFNPDVRVP
jgi:hypothetical protein